MTTARRRQIEAITAISTVTLALAAEASSPHMPRLNGCFHYDWFLPTWFILTMAMSICVEGAIYLYAHAFPRPFTVSALSNMVSLFAVDIFASPLAFENSYVLGSFFWVGAGCAMVLLYAAVEYGVVAVIRRFVGPDEQYCRKGRLFRIVLVANAVSTGILAIFIAVKLDSWS